ncbi:hypothetical protein CC78DRAFT_547568 [Lojkania enalia]|uniref:Uncharacterized protein n=1 Tax=Lojkania enalia TaxID=147567 RepID=A0A9P4K6G9_9PLEO|nr:hypothetical protein CC78DRAFT_547568 [Didymosphaeria enalia]
MSGQTNVSAIGEGAWQSSPIHGQVQAVWGCLAETGARPVAFGQDPSKTCRVPYAGEAGVLNHDSMLGGEEGSRTERRGGLAGGFHWARHVTPSNLQVFARRVSSATSASGGLGPMPSMRASQKLRPPTSPRAAGILLDKSTANSYTVYIIKPAQDSIEWYPFAPSCAPTRCSKTPNSLAGHAATDSRTYQSVWSHGHGPVKLTILIILSNLARPVPGLSTCQVLQ